MVEVPSTWPKRAGAPPLSRGLTLFFVWWRKKWSIEEAANTGRLVVFSGLVALARDVALAL